MRTLRGHHADTPRSSCGGCAAIARTLPGCCANRCANIFRCWVKCFQETARIPTGCCRTNVRMIHRLLRGCCAGRYVECCADIAGLPALHSCKGMVSRKIHGFQVSESRPNQVRLNATKWMILGALNGRSETGSETKQVGSGMNGRRRSARAVLERPVSA